MSQVTNNFANSKPLFEDVSSEKENVGPNRKYRERKELSLIENLPLEMLRKVFENLETPESLAVVSLVCKTFNVAVDDNLLWKNVVGKILNVKPFEAGTDFKSVYRDYKEKWPVRSTIYLCDMFYRVRRDFVDSGDIVDRRLPYAGEPEFELSRFLLDDLKKFAEENHFPIIDHAGQIERFFVENQLPLSSIDPVNYPPEILWIAEAIVQAPFSFPWLIQEQNEVSEALKDAAAAVKENLRAFADALREPPPQPPKQMSGEQMLTPSRTELKEATESGNPSLKMEKWVRFDNSWGNFIKLLRREQTQNKRETIPIGGNGQHHFPQKSLGGYYKQGGFAEGKAYFREKFKLQKNHFMVPELQIVMPQLTKQSQGKPTLDPVQITGIDNEFKVKFAKLFHRNVD